MKGKGSYPITRGGRVTGFRHRGGSKKASKPVKRRKVKQRVASHALKLPKVPATIEVSFQDELGFYDAWDAEEFYLWSDNAKKALIKKGIPLAVVNHLWRSIPDEDMALVDGDLSPVIPYGAGETFILDIEATFNEGVS